MVGSDDTIQDRERLARVYDLVAYGLLEIRVEGEREIIKNLKCIQAQGV